MTTTLALLLTSSQAHCQDLLDTEKNKGAELFVIKKGYDVPERLREIETISGKQVTVYEVSGKDNRVKNSYTGIAAMSTVPNFSDKQRASLIVVQTKGEAGRMSAYFPLTNSIHYRIYLTEKMK